MTEAIKIKNLKKTLWIPSSIKRVEFLRTARGNFCFTRCKWRGENHMYGMFGRFKKT